MAQLDNFHEDYRVYHVSITDHNHIMSTVCWCEPFLDYKDPKNKNEVWIHREFNDVRLNVGYEMSYMTRESLKYGYWQCSKCGYSGEEPP